MEFSPETIITLIGILIGLSGMICSYLYGKTRVNSCLYHIFSFPILLFPFLSSSFIIQGVRNLIDFSLWIFMMVMLFIINAIIADYSETH